MEIAGPRDIKDAVKVIDWAIEHPELRVDRDKIGMFGLSYGSGISQLTALADSRVKAVVALSTWADLAEALYDKHTRHSGAVETLYAVGTRPSSELRKIVDDFRNNDNIEDIVDWAKLRSPAHSTGTNYAPTFFTTYWHETLFPANQLLKYVDSYPGPKRLDVAIGDHGALDMLPAMHGVPGRATDAGYDWLDHYLLEVDNGIDSDGVMHLETMHNLGHTYSAPNTDKWSKRQWRFYLHEPRSESGNGLLATFPPISFRTSFNSGMPQVQMADAIIVNGFGERLGLPMLQSLADVRRTQAGVWTFAAPFAEPRHIAGYPELQISVTPEDKQVTVAAYLFDYNPLTKILRVITHAVKTVRNNEPKIPTNVQLTLQGTDYRVPRGHNIVFIVDSIDWLYEYGTNLRPPRSDLQPLPRPVPGGTLTLSSTHGHASITIPIEKIPALEGAQQY
ncbi:CocE/NonD family hydrolase [Nocardia goodfellowii]|uniref:Acyl esterase n=1 Tax=Nocardia goodfellowii TaxID=882446 RepID=A0ABS4QPL1_9NOCA|nr:putative acyl esterase [Nocardia goodfellowii]